MSVTLSNLVAQLNADVPPASGKPTADQYLRAVKDAVADFGRRCPITVVTTINVVTGTAAYDLPADFVRVVQFPTLRQLAQQGNVLITGAGIIPLSGSYNERYNVRNGKLTLYPTPQYTMARSLSYAAGFPLTNGAFTELGEDEAAIAMHKARDLILLAIADGVARDAWNYAFGDVSITKGQLAANLRDQAKGEREQYEEAIASRAGGTQTIQADYNANEYGSFSGSV